MLHAPTLAAAMVARGASATEARDILNDLIGDCFGGERARQGVDLEKLVMVRLMISYEVPQKLSGSLMGWHESKISRARSDLVAELRTRIMEEVRRADPWLELEWDDFMGLCAESMDLFAA